MVFLQGVAEARSLYDYIDYAGVVGLLILIILVGFYGLSKGWWYPGWYVRGLERENSDLKAKIDRVNEKGDSMTAAMIEVFKRRQQGD